MEPSVPLDPGQLARLVRGRVASNCRLDAVPAAGELEVDGARLVALSSDDLLGLAADARVREAITAGLRRYGLAKGAPSRLVDELEARLARQLSAGGAMVVDDPTALLAQLPAWRLLVDARSQHALDGPEPVGSPEEAERHGPGGGVAGVVVDAVHRTEGDLAPLPRYAEVCQRLGAGLVVLDRGLGVLGPTGGGAVEHLAMQDQVALHLLPLGEAIPGAGAVVAGPAPLIEALRGSLPAPPLALLAATARALELCLGEPQRRARLFDVAQTMISGLRARGFDTGPCVTPWIPVWLGDEEASARWLRALAEEGFACRAWLAGPRSRLLLAPPATLSDAQLTRALEAFERLRRRLPTPEAPSGGREPAVIARPGSYAMATPAALHWLTVEPRERPPAPPSARALPPRPASSPDALPLRERLQDAVETLTWRATNAGSTQLRRGAEAILALLDRRRR